MYLFIHAGRIQTHVRLARILATRVSMTVVAASVPRVAEVRRQPDGSWRFVIDAPNGLG
jgi:hypothetical protein